MWPPVLQQDGEYYPATFSNILAELAWGRSWVIRFQAAVRGLLVRAVLRGGDVAVLRGVLGAAPLSTVVRFATFSCTRLFDLAAFAPPVNKRRGKAVALAHLIVQ